MSWAPVLLKSGQSEEAVGVSPMDLLDDVSSTTLLILPFPRCQSRVCSVNQVEGEGGENAVSLLLKGGQIFR